MMPNKAKHQPNKAGREADKEYDHKILSLLQINTFIPQFIFIETEQQKHFTAPVQSEEGHIRK